MGYREIIKNHWLEKKKTNPGFSMRAFAKKLDLEASTLSQILRGKRDLPIKDAQKILSRLRLTAAQQRQFVQSLDPSASHSRYLAKYLSTPELESSRGGIVQKILEDWEYGAVLALMGVCDFQPNAEWIAQRLGLQVDRAQRVWSHLLAIGLVRKSGQGFVKMSVELKTSDEMMSKSLRIAHAHELEMAKQALRTEAIERRDFTSLTLAVEASKLKEAKALIRSFLKQMEELLETSAADHVYQVNVQMFPLSKERK